MKIPSGRCAARHEEGVLSHAPPLPRNGPSGKPQAARHPCPSAGWAAPENTVGDAENGFAASRAGVATEGSRDGVGGGWAEAGVAASLKPGGGLAPQPSFWAAMKLWKIVAGTIPPKAPGMGFWSERSADPHHHHEAVAVAREPSVDVVLGGAGLAAESTGRGSPPAFPCRR